MEWFDDVVLSPLFDDVVLSPLLHPTKESPVQILDDMIGSAFDENIETVCSILADDSPPTSKPKEGLLSTGVVFPTIPIDHFFGSTVREEESPSIPSLLTSDTTESNSNDTTAVLLDSHKRLRGFTITTRLYSRFHKKRLYNYTDDATGRTYTSMKLAIAARKRRKK